MATSNNIKYLFDGTFNIIERPDVLTPAKIDGHVTPSKNGFFRGTLYKNGKRYDIAGHLRKNHEISHFLFVITPYRSINTIYIIRVVVMQMILSAIIQATGIFHAMN